MWKGSGGCEFLNGVMCAGGMGCGNRWVVRVLLGAGTAIGRPEVPSMISLTMHWLSQSVVHSKMGHHECWRRMGDGGYKISVSGTYRRGRIALCRLDGCRWNPWGIPKDHEWFGTIVLQSFNCIACNIQVIELSVDFTYSVRLDDQSWSVLGKCLHGKRLCTQQLACAISAFDGCVK